MKIRALYIILFAIVVSLIYSCVKKPEYPSEPVISYKDFLRYGKDPADPDSVKLVLTFTDNEGDIGLDQSDTLPPFGHTGNLKMVLWVLDTAGVDHWIPYDSIHTTPQVDTFRIGFRVPLVLKEGEKNQPMKGLIYAKQEKPVVPLEYNTLRYDVYMYDRAKHQSNRITTPAFSFP